MDYQTQQCPQPQPQPQPQAQQPMQAMPVAPVAQAPAATKPRSAYVAALLHLIFGIFGFGYYYRGMNDKGKNCIIMLIVGIATSFLFGIGSIVITVSQIINMVEAVKLFKGSYPVDAYGRPLMQEF